MSEIWTRLKLIQWTAGHFGKEGIPNPRLDAELLLAHVLGCPRIDLYTHHEKTVSEKDRARFRELVTLRARREPLQYLTGSTEFWGLPIEVNPAVLIPRPETELLVEEAVKAAPSRVLEIGTGSGCVAVALARSLPRVRIIATDISPEALDLARKNAVRNEVADRIEFVLADIAPWRRFTAEDLSFDLIVSNPPYIPSPDFKGLQPEVRDYEPKTALDGGADGLDLVRKILAEAPDFLRPGCTLLMEIGETQAQTIRALVSEGPSFGVVDFRLDYSGIDRIARIRKS